MNAEPDSTTGSRAPKSGGYFKAPSPQNRWFNASVALLLLVVSLPVSLFVALLVVLSGRGPILYRSRRLGRGKRPFDMLKFRTLVVDAQTVLGDSLLTTTKSAELRPEHRFGRFLRETRLDELPQLVNVIRGEMDLVGPRPVRPEVYERLGRAIQGYEARFLTKPGLVGYAQLFTPHSSPKRLRSLIDYRYTFHKQAYASDLRLLLIAAATVVRRSILGSLRNLRELCGRILRGSLWEKRQRRRSTPSRATAEVLLDGRSVPCVVVDINDEALLVYTNDELPGQGSLALKLAVVSKVGGRKRRRVSHCHGTVYRQWAPGDGAFSRAYTLKYVPNTPLNAYRIARYFLDESLV